MSLNNLPEQIAQLLGVEFPRPLIPNDESLFNSMKAFRPGWKKDEHDGIEEKLQKNKLLCYLLDCQVILSDKNCHYKGVDNGR